MGPKGRTGNVCRGWFEMRLHGVGYLALVLPSGWLALKTSTIHSGVGQCHVL